MTKKTVMETIKIVLNGLKERHSYRQIEKEACVSHGFVGKVCRLVSEAGKTAAEVLALDDKSIRDIIYPPSNKRRREPNWDVVLSQKALVRKATALQLYDRYCAEDEDSLKYSYSSFCRLLSIKLREQKRAKPVVNAVRIPGERMEIDFSGNKFDWVDSDGVRHKAHIFVATLPYSSLLFAYASEDETQRSWIEGIIRAINYFGGVSQYLVMDNAKALVKHADWTDSIVQLAIVELCEHYGMTAVPCRVAAPTQKNRVESGCNDTQRFVNAEFELDAKIYYDDLEALNVAIQNACDKFNEKDYSDASHDSRRSLFQREEMPCLKPLPMTPYGAPEWRILVADKTHCVRIASDGGHRYSVPPSYVRTRICVRLSRNEVRLYDTTNNALIGVHERCYKKTGLKTHILEAHLSEEERKLRRSPTQFIDTFVLKGIDQKVATRFVNTLFKENPLTGRQQCGATLSLRKKHAPDILTKCIEKSLEHGNPRFSFIKALAEQEEATARKQCSLDLDSDSDPDPDYVTTSHGNIRNNYN